MVAVLTIGIVGSMYRDCYPSGVNVVNFCRYTVHEVPEPLQALDPDNEAWLKMQAHHRAYREATGRWSQ